MQTQPPIAGPIATVIERVFFHLAGLCLGLLFLVMMFGVVFRYLPISSGVDHWVPGLLGLLQVWLIFFGSLSAVVSHHHLRIGFIIERLPTRLYRGAEVVIWIIRFATLAVVLYASFAVVEKGFSSSIGGVPFTKGLVYVVLPIVLTLMILLELIRAKQALIPNKASGQ